MIIGEDANWLIQAKMDSSSFSGLFTRLGDCVK